MLKLSEVLIVELGDFLQLLYAGSSEVRARSCRNLESSEVELPSRLATCSRELFMPCQCIRNAHSF